MREKFPKAHVHSNSKSAPPQSRNRPNDFFHLGSLRITNRDTPGHAEDGVTYIVGTWPEDILEVASATPAFGTEATESGAVDAHWAAGQVHDRFGARPWPHDGQNVAPAGTSAPQCGQGRGRGISPPGGGPLVTWSLVARSGRACPRPARCRWAVQPMGSIQDGGGRSGHGAR